MPDADTTPPGPSIEELGSLISWLAGASCQAADAGRSSDAGMLCWAAQVVSERVDEDAPAPPAPAAGEGDEEPCEICGGLGTIDETLGGYADSNQAAECPGCGGSGCVSIDATPPAEGEVGELVSWIYEQAIHGPDGDEWRRATALIEQQAAELAMLRQLARPVAIPGDAYEIHMGDVMWWRFPIDEPPWLGTPGDSDWPGYHTHFTPHPAEPALPLPSEEATNA